MMKNTSLVGGGYNKKYRCETLDKDEKTSFIHTFESIELK